MHIFGKIRRLFRVIRLILTTNYNDAYIVSFNATFIGEDMLPYYRRALTRNEYHLYSSITDRDGTTFETWLKTDKKERKKQA